jgi:biopolymer transport protein ExbB/TolQ
MMIDLVSAFLVMTFLILSLLLFARMQESQARAFHNISVHQKDISLSLLEAMRKANHRADDNAQVAAKQAYDWAEAERDRREMEIAEASFKARRTDASGFPIPEEELCEWREQYRKEHFLR